MLLQLLQQQAGLENVITVSSTNKNQELAYYSNYGNRIDLVALAGDFGDTYFSEGQINVTYMMLMTKPMKMGQNFIDQAVGLPAGYTLSFGTSLAAPQVSAALALLMAEDKAKNPNPQKYVNQFYRGAVDLGDPGPDEVYGQGELNITKSLKSNYK
ncbi:S8 family serine peptidase [Bacillus massiliglaciei]|uniref:S8 family serine peptidase n=1 Tax=Bacillus massiliglaciei TaxID=1816693 RepID=UPI001F251393